MKFIFLLAFILFGNFVFSQNEIGFLSIKNFGQEDFNSQVQNFYVTQDKDAIVYVGNKEGILEYRGGMWRKHQLSNVNDAKAIKISHNGIIYVGGINEFGFFNLDTTVSEDPPPNKDLFYYSLRKYIDSTLNFGDINEIEIQNNNVYFLSNNYLFFWNRKELKTIHSENSLTGFIKYHGKLYIKLNKYGIQRVDNGKLFQVRNVSQILVEQKDKKVQEGSGNKKVMALGLSMYVEYNKEWLLAYSKLKGFYLFKIEDDALGVKPYNFHNTQILKDFNVSSFIKISDDIFAFGSSDDGILLTTSTGDIIFHLNTKTNLASNKVNSLYFDKQNHLWAALAQGISRIKLNDNWQKFKPEISGYSGIIESITRFNGHLYLTSIDGMFELEKPEKEGMVAKFVRLKDSVVDKGCYWLMNFNTENANKLLIITDDGIAEMDEKGNFNSIIHGFIWIIKRDRVDPNRIWVGLDNGLASLYFNGKGFDVEGRVPGVNIRCHFIEQDSKGAIWVSNEFSQVIRLSNTEFINNKITNFDLRQFTSKDGLPADNAIYPKEVAGEMVFGTGEGVFAFNPDSNRFIPSGRMGVLFKDDDYHKGRQAHRLFEDKNHNVWIISKNQDESRLQIYKLLLPDSDTGTYKAFKVFETKGKGDIFNAIYEDGSNTMWFGGVMSLYKYSRNVAKDNFPLFYSYVYQVVAGNDTVMSGYEYINNHLYTSQQPGEIEVIKYKNNKLNFHYASLLRNNEEQILFSYMLEGFEDVWSKWDTRNEERFTNLPEGSYIFRVRAMDPMGNISSEATYRFDILPPWYRTIWAYIGYFLFFVAFVWGAITVSTRSLKKIIREATAEIQEQKDQLEEKNQNILDSIRYAKRIQEAVTPTESQMKKFFPEHFVLWRPRDIVSGDFFWMMHKGNKVVVAAADCTGHGVPGAFMSIMGISFLNQIANMPEVKNAADALNHLRSNVITSLNQEGSETDTKDGMDISLCVYNFEEMIMEFSGAYNPLYMIRDGELSVVKADRMPVGVHDRMDKPFTNNKFTMMKGDVYYILSDGYIDQFGGEKGKKFMTRRFKELLLTIYDKPMDEQSRILEETLLKWRGEIEQVDDIIIIGVRVV